MERPFLIAAAIAGAVAAVVSAIKALIWLLQAARAASRYADTIAELVALADGIRDVLGRELEHNHGGSLKDDVHGIAVGQYELSSAVDQLRAELSDLQQQFNDHTTGSTP